MQIRQGDVFWIKINNENEKEIIHPNVVIQDDLFNKSRIETTIVCGISTNMNRAYMIGNIVLNEGEANLPKKSVIVVSQISSVKKDALGEYIGTLSRERVKEIFSGLQQVQDFMNK